MSSSGDEKTVFFPGLSADGGSVHHVVTIVHILHVSVIVLYNEWFRSVSILITEISFCWRMMHIRQQVYVPFVLPYCGCEVTPYHGLYVTPFQSQILSKILQHYFLI